MEKNKKGKIVKSLEGIVQKDITGKFINASLMGAGLYVLENTALGSTELGHYLKMGGWMCIVMDASSIGTYLLAKATLVGYNKTYGKNKEDGNCEPEHESSECH